MPRSQRFAAIFMFLCNSVANIYGSTRPCHPKTTVDLTNTQSFNYNSKCAVEFQNTLPWTEARDFCRKGGGELVKFSTQEDVDTLSSSELKIICYWTGLNDRQTEGEYLWLDGTGTDLHHVFSIRVPTSFDEGADCVSFCENEADKPRVWFKQKCDFALPFLCVFEMIHGITHTTTLPARANNDRVTTVLNMEVASTRPSPEGTTGKVTSTGAAAVGRYRGLQSRTKLFTKETLKGQPYLLAVPAQTVKSWSATHCCARCTTMGGCFIANFNQNRRICRLFTTRQALLEGTKDVPGWIVFISV